MSELSVDIRGSANTVQIGGGGGGDVIVLLECIDCVWLGNILTV